LSSTSASNFPLAQFQYANQTEKFMNINDKLLLNEKEAAELLSISTHFLRRDRISLDSAGIPFIKVGTAVRYCRADLMKWIEDQASKRAQPKVARPPIETQAGKRRRGRPTKAEQVVRGNLTIT
jgi:excisionase family DNA binding protein